MAFRYELRFTDGEDAGTFDTIPGPRIGEFVDAHGVEGLWMVEAVT